MRHLCLSLFLCLSTAACVSQPYGGEPSTPSASGGYSSSVGSSISSSSEPVSVSVAQRPGSNDLVVRPDAVEIAFALTAKGSEPDKVLAGLKERADSIAQKIKAAAGAAETKMCGASASPAGSGKALSDDQPPRYAIRVDGSLTIPLKPEQDYWARSAIMASLARTTREIVAAERAEAEKSDKAEQDAVHIGFSEPQLRVKDTEPYRDKLLARWVQRTKKLAAAAESEKAPLAVVDCTPPGDVEQRVLSLEEISLSLPVSCKLGAVAAQPRAAAP